MRNIFVRKVETERKILKIINDTPGNKAQLAGLTSNAIEVWRNKSQLDNLDEIVPVLNELARLCGLLSSRSGEGLRESTDGHAQEIEASIQKLKSLTKGQGG